MILLDANVLVYASNADAPEHVASRALLGAAFKGRLAAALVPQVLLEYFAIVTDPRRTQHPLSAEDAWSQVESLRASLPVLEAGGRSLAALGELVVRRRPAGQDIFDLFLVAQVRGHGIATICTYEVSDFAGIPGIRAERPQSLLDDLSLD